MMFGALSVAVMITGATMARFVSGTTAGVTADCDVHHFVSSVIA
jgi:hypothetical protein